MVTPTASVPSQEAKAQTDEQRGQGIVNPGYAPVLSYTLTLTAYPSIITADGVTAATLTATVRTQAKPFP